MHVVAATHSAWWLRRLAPVRRWCRSAPRTAPIGCTSSRLCAVAGALCLVDDRVDVALAAGAAGTHLDAQDLPVAAVRRVAGSGHLVGGTARDPQGAAALVAAGVDYLGVGPAYPTITKAGLPAALGLAGLTALTTGDAPPAYALGGVHPPDVTDCLAAGACGIAVMGPVMRTPQLVAAYLIAMQEEPA